MLIDTLPVIADPEASLPLWKEYQRLIAEQQPYTFVYFSHRIHGVRERLRNVNPDARGDWGLRVFADGKELVKQSVGPPGAPWKQVSVDLTPYAGKKSLIRLENAATGWSWEFGYWADLEVRSE